MGARVAGGSGLAARGARRQQSAVLTVCGVLGSREIGEQLKACDALLFICRGFSTRRGSTSLAAIA